MQSIFKVTSLLFLVLALCSCANEDAASRESHWKGLIDKYDPSGRTASDVFTYLTENEGVPMNSFPRGKDGSTILLERVEGEGAVCSDWIYLLDLELTDASVVQSWEVSSEAACL